MKLSVTGSDFTTSIRLDLLEIMSGSRHVSLGFTVKPVSLGSAPFAISRARNQHHHHHHRRRRSICRCCTDVLRDHVASPKRQACPVRSFICSVKDAVWHGAQSIVPSHTSDNWRLLKYPLFHLFPPRPGHGVQNEMRGKVDVDFSSIFVHCKFPWVRLDDLRGGGRRRRRRSCCLMSKSSLIQTSSGMQGQTCFDVLLHCQVQRVERALFIYQRSGTVATPTDFGFCPSTTVRMRSGL